jgi:hypothetical protein
VYRARFFFDAGAGTSLWSANDATRERFDYPIELELLPVSDKLRAELTRLVEEYDKSIDWDYPPDPSPWSAEQRAEFNNAVRGAVKWLRVELRDDWDIVDEFRKLPED